MNILHHKSWHVRTKANIARVRRDEEKAAKDEEERKRKVAIAEQEARTALLRDRARQRAREDNLANDSQSDVIPSKIPRHINFFAAAEAGVNEGTNPEREKEKKAEQEQLEKKIGLLRYLDEPAEKPWYLKTRTKEDIKLNKKKLAQQRSMNFLDPLTKMTEYTSKTHAHKQKHRSSEEKYKPKSESTIAQTTVAKSSSTHSSQSKSMEQLRAERLKRERQERLRAESLMNKSKGEKRVQPEVELDDRSRGYNSQFNPELSRQYRNKRSFTR